MSNQPTNLHPGRNANTDQTGDNNGETRRDLMNLKRDVDQLISDAGSQTESELRIAYSQLLSRVNSLPEQLAQLAAQAERRLDQQIDATAEYVKDKPLQAISIAVGIGLLIGALVNRR